MAADRTDIRPVFQHQLVMDIAAVDTLLRGRKPLIHADDKAACLRSVLFEILYEQSPSVAGHALAILQ